MHLYRNCTDSLDKSSWSFFCRYITFWEQKGTTPNFIHLPPLPGKKISGYVACEEAESCTRRDIPAAFGRSRLIWF